MRMSSFVPRFASDFASFTNSSIGREMCPPRMSGMAQNAARAVATFGNFDVSVMCGRGKQALAD
jgi:hypothetical protein